MDSFDELIALRLIDAQGDQRTLSAHRQRGGELRRPLVLGPTWPTRRPGCCSRRWSPAAVVAAAHGGDDAPLLRADRHFRGAVLAPMDLATSSEFLQLDVGAQGVVFLPPRRAGQLVLRAGRRSTPR